LVTENDQLFEKALLVPSHWDNVFVGTSCQGEFRMPKRVGQGQFADFTWDASYSPRDEEDVPWPVWWPPNPAKEPNWYQQKDFFCEKVTTGSSVPVGRHRILAVMRSADELEPDPLRIETLDIILLHVSPDAARMVTPPVTPKRAEAKADPPNPFAAAAPSASPWQARFTVFTFGVGDREAVALLSRTGPHRDKKLLEHLLKESAAYRAPLRDFLAVNTRSGQRATVESARWYSYPTEMPTIPSAWGEYPSGTRMEIDPLFPRSVTFAFEYHPVPPRRAEWRCALDTPDLFMWQPQFIVRRINSAMECGADGVALIGAMRTADCNLGVSGLSGNETLVSMLRLDDNIPLPKVAPPGGDPDYARLELEAIVFDVPATEAASWTAPASEKERAPAADDSQRFATLLERVDDKQVKIAAHVAVGASVGNGYINRAHRVSAVELVKTVAVIENNDSPIRYRPTAVEETEVGTTLEVDPAVDPNIALTKAKLIDVSYTLKHDVAMPQQPDYRDMIASLDEKKNPSRRPPPAIFFQEIWKGDATVNVGGTQFIGARTPPGEKMKDRLHVAFLRVRVVQ
jgi:hypothetical protein